MDNCEIQIWDINNGKKVNAFKGHRKPATDICFLPNTTWFASSSADKTVKIWYLKRKKCIKSFKNHTQNARFVKALPLFNEKWQFICSGGEDGKVCFYAWNKKTKRFK